VFIISAKLGVALVTGDFIEIHFPRYDKAGNELFKNDLIGGRNPLDSASSPNMDNTRVPCIYTALTAAPECYLHVSETYSDTNPYIKVKLGANLAASTTFTLEVLA